MLEEVHGPVALVVGMRVPDDGEDGQTIYTMVLFRQLEASEQRLKIFKIGTLIPTWRVLSAASRIVRESFALEGHVIQTRRALFVGASAHVSTEELYPAQVDVVRKTSSLRKGIVLVHGPPGTGKTTTAVQMLSALKPTIRLADADDDLEKILVCAPTNTAVVNVLSKYIAGVEPSNVLEVLLVVDEARIPSGYDDRTRQAALNVRVDIVCRALRDASDLKAEWNDLDDEKRRAGVDTLLHELGSLIPALFGSFGVTLGDPADSLIPALFDTFGGTLGDPADESALLELVVKQVTQTLRRIATAGRSPKAAFTNFFLRKSRIVFSTVCSAGKSLFDGVKFPVVLVDEAAQAQEALTLIILRPETERLFLVGDPKQLPATVFSDVCKDAGYDRSLMERRAISNDSSPDSILLNIQHRMHPAISVWPNQRFYSGKLVDASCTLGRSFDARPFQFVNVAQGSECRDPYGSLFNRTEAAVVIELLNDLKLPKGASIGVVTPYRAQREKIESAVKSHRLPADVNTVDGFQGQERDVIIFSAVRTNPQGKIGFLKDRRRMNVALTRARQLLVLVGDIDTLSRGDPLWRSLVESAKQRGSLIELAHDNLLKKTRIKDAIKLDRWQRFIRLSPEKFFRNTEWDVSFVAECGAQLREVATETQYILECVRKLLEGSWPRRQARESYLPDTPAGNDVHVIRVGRLRIFWTVELKPLLRSSGNVKKQEIRMWGVKRDLLRNCKPLAGRIMRYRESQSEIYLAKCREIEYDGNVAKPKQFEVDESSTEFGSRKEANTDGDPLSNAKSFELNEDSLRLLAAGTFDARSCAFRLSREEARLVSTQGNLLLLGRSGTGKTNVLIERVLQRRHASLELGHEVPQLVITASPRLCQSLRTLCISRCSAESGDAVPLISFLTYEQLLRKLYEPDHLKLANPDDFHAFWQTVDQSLTKHFSAAFVRAEITSRIKGRRETLEKERAEVTEDEYVHTTARSRRADRLAEHQCRQIYKIYLAYERAKRSDGTKDANDAAHHLFRRFASEGRPPEQFQFVYVDEVQDLTVVHLALLKFICPHGAGFSLAGDTAQAISGACSFRFEELKDLFHHHFLSTGGDELVPQLHTLGRNYRTHDRILGLANKIIALLTEHFPGCVDKLAPELSFASGPKPLFVDAGADAVHQLFSDRTEREFGAEQAILVRTDAEVARLGEQGVEALTMTIMESKGLEVGLPLTDGDSRTDMTCFAVARTV